MEKELKDFIKISIIGLFLGLCSISFIIWLIIKLIAKYFGGN